MKKCAAFLLMLSLLTSCTAVKDTDFITTHEATNQAESKKPITVEKIGPGEITILIAGYPYVRPDVGYVWEWQEYIRNKHNLDVELKYTLKTSKEGMSVADIKGNSYDDGFIYIDRKEDLVKLVESGIIIPVNEFISQIPSVSVLDDLLVEQFADSDDDIWAIPLSNKMGARYRTYNYEWIKKWGKGQPVTIDEYLEFAYYIKDNDLDENGVRDSYVSAFYGMSLFHEFEDIFKAFGCYVSGSGAIEYNPLKDKYEIVLLNENFEEAITFIKFLYDEGLIIESEKVLSDRFDEPYNVASAVSTTPLQKYESLTTGYYLTGSNTTDLIRYGGSNACLAVLAGTEDIPEKIEYLFSKLSESQECVMDFSWGIEGKSYIAHDGYYTCYYEDDNENSTPRIGINTYIKSDNYIEKPIIQKIHSKDITDEYIESYVKSIKTLQAVRPDFSNLYKDEKAYTVNYLQYSPIIKEIESEILVLTRETITAMLKGIVTIEEGLAQYRKNIEELGIIERMNEVN